MHVPPVFCFLATSLPLMREVAKRSFDGGRERSQSLNDVVRPFSLSLANARQLPRQREPRKRKSIGCLAEGAKRPKINPSRVPGSPCQGSWRRRRLRGSLNVPFSPSASLTLGSSLVRGSQKKRKSFSCLAEGAGKTKILSFL